MNKPFVPPPPAAAALTVSEIRDEVWLEVARQHGRPPPPAAPPAAPVRDLAGLLALDGMGFVEAAYAALLGRLPDDEGAAYLMRELAAGASKLRLLGGLQRSAEARRAGRTLPGLRLRFLAHRCARIPGLRRLARPAPPAPPAAPLAAPPAPAPELAALQAEIHACHAAIRDLSARLATGAQAAERRLAGLEDSSVETLVALADGLDGQAARLARLEGQQDGAALQAQLAASAATLRTGLDARLAAVEAVVQQNRGDVVDQERRIGLVLEALRRREGAVPPALQAEDARATAQLYVDFEDRFRGSRADITARLRVYLPLLAEARAGSPARPVLDVGCGRGEFLALLQAEGLCARGVDSNAAMAEACRAQGLDCTAEDALAYLGRQAEGALGAVTGVHVVEHLAFPTMVRLFDAALRALAPGGLLALETPNPANLLVASRWFYLDPTHRNPLPGEMLAMIAEARGFCRVSVVPLHPMAQRFAGADPALCAQLDALFHGPQDYALLARKP